MPLTRTLKITTSLLMLTIVQSLIAGCNQENKECCACETTPKSIENDRLMLENYSLKNEINILKKQQAVNSEQCNIADRLRQERKLQEEKQKNEQALQVRRLDEEKVILSKLRTATMPLREWEKYLLNLKKSEVQNYLGEPGNKKQSSDSSNFFWEAWKYHNKVAATPTEPKKTLNIFFERERVVKVESAS